jgi:hypothetical protein
MHGVPLVRRSDRRHKRARAGGSVRIQGSSLAPEAGRPAASLSPYLDPDSTRYTLHPTPYTLRRVGLCAGRDARPKPATLKPRWSAQSDREGGHGHASTPPAQRVLVVQGGVGTPRSAWAGEKPVRAGTPRQTPGRRRPALRQLS